MPRLELNFLPHDYIGNSEIVATDQQLLLQMVYGLCGQLRNPREENCRVFTSSVDIPLSDVRRVAKLIVEKFNLPIPVERVDEWVQWQQTNQCWGVNEEMGAEATRLATLSE